ncbi:LuxR family maltose regulon positive regulatory protein [Flavimobilis soli]|uniref:LuxR family maltose regulon positive regulatory protein n=1 Tax=Flavimobilis soli TaxID=442709 RepID=A0A2A9EC21_9MICO|nr:LuxR C-terminal-related transcriptional regulator [Flavimobilis soli]PFG36343.1 LuxR family maltose regulon positive regulatory protein [Flavimobilis soli]
MLAAQWLRSMQDDDVDVLWLGTDVLSFVDGPGTEAFWDVLGARLEEFAGPQRKVSPVSAIRGRERVVQLLSRRTRPVYVVLDRFEQTFGHLGIEQSLLDLVQTMENFYLIVCTRTVTSLEVVGAAVVDSVVLRPADLALGVEDVLGLAAQQGIVLGRDEAQTLCDETAGWPALVRVILAGSAADQVPGAGFALNLDAGRWFLRSVWDEFAVPGLADFVTRTSVLVEFTRSLAARVCGEEDVDGHIDALLGAGLLRVHGSGEEAVYAHLPAVRRECVQRLRSEAPEEFRELSRVSAEILLDQGRAGQALVHLVRARLWDEVVECVEGAWHMLAAQGESELLRLVDRLPVDVVARSPRLVVLRDYSSEAKASGASDRHKVGNPGAPLLGRIAGLGPGTSPAARERARGVVDRYVDLAPEVRAAIPAVLCEVGAARLARTDTDGATAAFTDAHRLAAAIGVVAAEARAAVGAALTATVTGDIKGARSWIDEADRAFAASSSADVADLVPILASARALAAIAGVDLPTARAAVVDATGGDTEVMSLGTLARAQLSLLEGGQYEEFEEFEKASQWAMSSALPADDLITKLLVAARVDLLLSMGQVLRARAVLTRWEGDPDGLLLPRVRTAFMAGDYGRAALLASQGAHSTHRPARQRLGLQLVAALAENARGREVEAVRAMREAIAVAADSELFQPFASLPRPLLEAMVPSVPELADVLARLDDAGVRADVFPVPSVVAELSEREREVLETLAVSDSLGAVAKRLYLTTNTVKTHLRSIYRKLGTHSGAETIQRAIECGLIEAPSA